MQPLMSRSASIRPCGLDGIPGVPWGQHICQFYRTADDLTEVLVPYFRAGLEANEQCIWVTSEPLGVDAARRALLVAVPDLPVYEARGQILFVEFATAYGRRAADELIQGWLECEEGALRSGYDGLRVTANAYGIERAAWDEFARYERRVVGAIEGRRILAVCSYSLDRCVASDLLDVLNNHDSTLVRDENGWRFIDRTVLPGERAPGSACCPPAPVHRGHDVQFYDDEAFPARRVASFLVGSIEAGGGAVAVATGEHLSAICASMLASEFDVGRALGEGRLLLFDAERVLGWLHVGGRLDPAQFEGIVGARVRASVGRFGRVRWFGELVDLLCRQSREADAVRVEGWWNHLREQAPFDLLCAYSYSSFAQPYSAARFEDVCGAHAVVEYDDEPAPPEVDVGRVLAHLKQRTLALEHAAARTRKLDVELARALSRRRSD